MSTTLLSGSVVRTECIIRKSSNVAFDTHPLWQVYHAQAASNDNEPPRKRLKLESDVSEDVQPLDLPAAIPIARVAFALEDPSSPASTPGTLPSGVSSIKTAREVEVDVKTVTRSDGNAITILLVSPKSATTKFEVLVKVTHHHAIDEIMDLELVTQLHRRPADTAAKSAVQVRTCLRYTETEPRGQVDLESILSWRDGWASPLDKAGQSVESQVLRRYFGVPTLAAGTSGSLRLRPANGTPVKPQDFYDTVHIPDRDITVAAELNQTRLQTELYPFQQRAVTWMLGRERSDAAAEEFSPAVMSFRPIEDLYGKECFISDLEAVLVSGPTLRLRIPVRGGILCEEMGLGKTCELLSLICAHNREDFGSTKGLRTTGATLVVTPNTILQQWKAEIDRHAPHLNWTHYEGMASLTRTKRGTMNATDFMEKFADMDVVLVTYTVLASEIYFATDPPERNLRHKAGQRERPRSPLVQMEWWRVCLDEAQMVESGVSKAAQTAALIPRRNAWAVSGTPVKKDVQDLRGLLIFLGQQPYVYSDQIWKRLVGYHDVFAEEFKQLFGNIALRHTKDVIRNELRLPPQRRVVVTMPFTTVEEQNYQNLFEQMADECGLLPDGSPSSGLWDPDDPRTVEKMREWLTRLRQTCLHPQVGARNKRALGRSGGPLRTVEEVLGVMIEQNETAIGVEARGAVSMLCLQGHIYLNAKDIANRAELALEHYKKALERAQTLVTAAREELASMPEPAPKQKTRDEDDEESPEQKRCTKLRNQLRTVLGLQHMCEFFIGTAYFQLKSGPGIEENSGAWQAFEKGEVKHYDKAKDIRREILREDATRADIAMKVAETASHKPFDKGLPSMMDLDLSGGIQSQRVLDKADQLSDILEKQTTLLTDWKSQVMQRLVKKLVDVEEDEITGEEYEDSTKHQHEMNIYFEAFRAVITDRFSCITGQINGLVNYEIKQLFDQSRSALDFDKEEGRESQPTDVLTFEVLSQRLAIRQKDDRLLSLRGLAHEARNTESNLQLTGGDSARMRGELHLVQRLLAQIEVMSKAYSKVQDQLVELEDLFRVAFNERTEFYSRLQQLSDMVAPWREEADEQLDRREMSAATQKLQKHEKVLSTLQSKRRFLLHIREQSDNEAERICVICQHSFEQGVLTVCGHQFCKECINLWWREHRTCPVCKRGLSLRDFNNITYRVKDLKAHEEIHSSTIASEDSSGSSTGDTPDPDATTKIYDNISASDLDSIKSIDLPSPRSFGTKIDTISRHLLHILRTNPGTKTLIFSQYRDFLTVLSSALTTFSISHVPIGAKDSITRFHEDPSIEAFLLDAKTDSSGLNLVNATNVMLCEPLVNPGIELQAIARVHRIGQTRPTSVFMYLVNGTVEEGIYDVSVRRRLEIMHRSKGSGSRSASRGATPGMTAGEVDKAERLEMQKEGMEKLLGKGKGGGETVKAEDLWRCLFGAASRHDAGKSFLEEDINSFAADTGGGQVRNEVQQFVRAEAAEERRRR